MPPGAGLRTRDHIGVLGMDDGGGPRIRCFGRTDDMLIVLGVNVFPSAVADLVAELHPRTTGALRIDLPDRGPHVEPPLRVTAEYGPTVEDVGQLKRELEERIRDRLTHQGDYMGVPATGRSFSIQHMHMYRVVDGKLAEHWACRDDLGQLIQLGLAPTPSA